MKNLVQTLGRRSMAAAALLALAVTTTLQAAPPAVLSELPADAKAVVVINNVKDLGAKISNAAVRLNLPAPPDMPAYIGRLVGINKGIDAPGSAALVILTLPDEKEGDKPAMVMLLPTTDAKAMMENFQPGAEDKAGVSEITLPNDRAEKGYIATVGNGKWVAMAQDKAALDVYLARKNPLDKAVGAEALKTFETNDLVIWANVPVLAGPIDKTLEARQEDMINMMGVLNRGMDPTALAMQKAVFKEYFTGIRQYVKDANAGMITVRLSDAGLTLGAVSSFKPDSPFGKFIAAQKNAKPVAFQGLPNGEVLMAGGFNWDSASVAAQMTEIFKRVTTDEAVAKDPKSKELANASEQLNQIMKLVNGGSVVLLDPGPGAKGGLFQGAYVVDSPEPAKLMALQLEILKNSALKAGALSGGIKQNTTVTPDAVTIKNIKLTKIQVAYSLEDTTENPASDNAKKQLELVKKFHGAEGMTLYAAVVGKRYLMVLGSDARILESAVAAAEANAPDLANNQIIAGSEEQVLPNAIAAMYFSTGKFITTIQQAMMPGGPALNVNAGGNPIVASAAVNGSIVTAELHIPTATITAIKDLAGQMQQMMVPGGGPGAAPGGAPGPSSLPPEPGM